MNRDQIKSIHFVGIKGVGLAALAVWAKTYGIGVTGSDVDEEFPTDEQLKKFQIPVLKGFTKSHVLSPDIVITTGAHGGMQNPEVQEAIRKNIPTFLHGEALGVIMKMYKEIAIAGCHGKTTTSAMTAHLLRNANLDPSFAIGCGEILSLGSSGWAGKGEYFIGEADEYINGPPDDKRPKLLFLHPHIAVVTNVEFDHPDAYADLQEIEEVYGQFTQRVSPLGTLILNVDDPVVRRLSQTPRCNVVTFGYKYLDADVHIEDVDLSKPTHFLLREGNVKHSVSLSVPGLHNVYNATAALLAANAAGLSYAKICPLLETFRGTKRRFELIIDTGKKVLYDDYAHHPTEIRATLQAARSWYPKAKITAIFQPHTYSRTKALFQDFCRSFFEADTVLITDIYSSAREKPDRSVTGEKLRSGMVQYHASVHYTPQKNDVLRYLSKHMREIDVVITMGAGDVYQWGRDIAKLL